MIISFARFDSLNVTLERRFEVSLHNACHEVTIKYYFGEWIRSGIFHIVRNAENDNTTAMISQRRNVPRKIGARLAVIYEIKPFLVLNVERLIWTVDEFLEIAFGTGWHGVLSESSVKAVNIVA